MYYALMNHLLLNFIMQFCIPIYSLFRNIGNSYKSNINFINVIQQKSIEISLY